MTGTPQQISPENMVAEDLAYWPVPPVRVLQVAGSDASLGIAIAKHVPSLSMTIIVEEDAAARITDEGKSANVAGQLNIVCGPWAEVHWGGGYEIVIVHDRFRHLSDLSALHLLGKSWKCLAVGGRLLALEPTVYLEDRPVESSDRTEMETSSPISSKIRKRRLYELATAADFTSVHVSSLSSTDWSLAVLERDPSSAYLIP